MNVKITLNTTYDSDNSHDRDPVWLEVYNDEVIIRVGYREVRVKKSDLLAVLRVFEMTEGRNNA